MSENINSLLKLVEEFQNKNATTLLEYKSLIDKTIIAIFKEACLKPHLNSCEPEFCSFRITEVCKYPEYLHKLNNIRLL